MPAPPFEDLGHQGADVLLLPDRPRRERFRVVASQNDAKSAAGSGARRPREASVPSSECPAPRT